MKKHNKLRNLRPKATFGVDGAVSAAATLTAAGMQTAATLNAARQQADAAREAARTQADALRLQDENNKKLQENSINFTKNENEINRDLQKQIQMNLQMLTGQQNVNELREAAKIQVKNGGSAKRKLRNTSFSSLRGSNGNLPFTVTDGGAVVPLGVTSEGYDLYEIIGNDHKHYHKTQNGKAKTGVGIRFEGKQTIEGEGNQNSNQGELMLVTPTDAKFISKHSIKGFNPAKAVLAGVNPIDAFETQEAIKDVYGISDDGKGNDKTPVRRMRTYGGVDMLPIVPNLSLDFIAPTAVGVVSSLNDENTMRTRSLKCGGKIRGKAVNGTYYTRKGIKNPFMYYPTHPIYDFDINDNRTKSPNNTEGMNTYKGNLLGAGINAGANLLSAGISNIGNRLAQRYLTSGYRDAGNTLANAYSQLKTIDPNTIRRQDFAAAHAMAALQAPIVNTGAERAVAERSLHRNLARINRNTLSSAAAQDRSARVETAYNDITGQIESNAEKIRQGIIQENMKRITDVANENATRDVYANRDYANAHLALLQYNNDIENEKITGSAQARADMITSIAGIKGDTIRQNLSNIGNAINVGGNAIGSAFQTNAKMKTAEEMALLGANMENQYLYYLNHPNARGRNNFKRHLRNSGINKYMRWAANM